jgi:hypothetical protein
MWRTVIMQQLTPQAQQQITELAQRYDVSPGAVMTLLQALVNGNGTMAQFEHGELGGSGQWMRGGMVMVGDMCNHALKAKVDGLCSELSTLFAAQPFQPVPPRSHMQNQGAQHQQQGASSQPDRSLAQSSVSLFIAPPAGTAGSWWPADLGTPTTTGAQNSMRYAYFPHQRRLAVEVNGHMTLYDTLDHQISGVSQQQGIGGFLTFTSQHGVVPVATLPVVSSGHRESPEDRRQPHQSTAPSAPPTHPSDSAQETDIFAKIERLAELKQKGILSEDEFAAKKAELLRRV